MPKTASSLFRGHLLFAGIPAAFLLVTGIHAVRSGFIADPRFFEPAQVNPHMTTELIQVLTGEHLIRRTAGVWGLGGDPLDPETPGVQILGKLAKPGTRVQVDASGMSEARRSSLPRRVFPVEGPYAAAKGADLLVILGTREEYRRPDLFRLAKIMKKKVLLDARSGIDTRLSGMELFPDYWISAPRSWPTYLDPELHRFAEEVARRVPEEGSILLVPRASPMPLLLGRWFLPLNYLLYPRKLYLSDAAHAGGTNPEFRKWTLDASNREFDSREAAGEVGAAWILGFSLWVDFRIQDCALESVGEVPAPKPEPDSR